VRKVLAGVVTAVTAVTMAVAGSALASTPRPAYPVPYNFGAGIANEVLHPGSSPAGANDWSCKPTQAHPEPVVLLHGLLADQTDNWATMSPLLANHGFCVFSLTYGTDPGVPFPLDQVGGLVALEQSSQQVAAFIHRVLAVTGAAKVDLLGHSEGTVQEGYYVKFLGGRANVAKVVALTPLWHGTNAAGLATLHQLATTLGFGPQVNHVVGLPCGACTEFLSDSPFMARMQAGGGPTVPGIAYTDIMTRYDELVVPYTSGIVHAPNVRNIVLQDLCPQDLSEHAAVAADEVAAQHVLNALDPAHAAPVHCALVLPGVGG
jgi:triacylglycerol lipase